MARLFSFPNPVNEVSARLVFAAREIIDKNLAKVEIKKRRAHGNHDGRLWISELTMERQSAPKPRGCSQAQGSLPSPGVATPGL